MIINYDFNSGRVHGQRFAEGAGLAHEYAASLAEGTIDGLDYGGLPAPFGSGPVLPPRQDRGVGLPLIGEEPTMPVVMGRQGLPEPPQGRFAPAAQRPADAPSGPLDDQP